ncbi:MAG TPA: DUF1848 domain-containing protein [Candidatus Cloacimonas acidaminovorans]|nr:DUF1848 domain-containing protein [Candidatus Cloacimonas acidaminovorans]
MEPVIISASRATDIPAFYSDWLISRVKAGYLRWKNPFNGQFQDVSFAKTRLFVFWSKNPFPMLKKLSFFDEKGYNYYFQFTLNDYEQENWEKNLPSLQQRLNTFIELSELIGKQKVIWRFDPFILSDKLHPDELLKRIENIGDQLFPYTNRLVISFIDIEIYQKVKRNLNALPDNIQEIDTNTMHYFARELMRLNQKWNLKIATCAEKIDLQQYGIEHNRCIDDRLIIELFSADTELMNFLGYRPTDQTDFLTDQNEKSAYSYKKLKDKGQRKFCGCIKSKDIGQYNTCPNGCVYCYANLGKGLDSKIMIE